MSVNASSIFLMTQAWALGVILDFIFSCATEHVSKSFQRWCQNLRRIWCLLAISAAKTLVQTTVVSHLDYCNSSRQVSLPLLLISFSSIKTAVKRILWKHMPGISLAVQWLGLHASTAGDQGLIHDWGTKILQAVWHGQKKKSKNKTYVKSRNSFI